MLEEKTLCVYHAEKQAALIQLNQKYIRDLRCSHLQFHHHFCSFETENNTALKQFS